MYENYSASKRYSDAHSIFLSHSSKMVGFYFENTSWVSNQSYFYSLSRILKIPLRNVLRGSLNRRTTFPKRSTASKTSSTSTTKIPTPFSTRFSKPTGPPRRKYMTRSTTVKPLALESQEDTSSTTTKPNTNIFTNPSRRPFLRRPIKLQTTTTNLSIITDPGQNISLEFEKTEKPKKQNDRFQQMPNTSLASPTFEIAGPDDLHTTEITSTTVQPRRSSTKVVHPLTTTRPILFSTLRSSTSPLRPVIKYTIANTSPYASNNFYKSDPVLMDQLPAQSNVLIHSNGLIECLDQGNFPHPVSCKKFISCTKMEKGRMIGWEYTCPKNLSFDPIGGICNWSADVLCDDS